MLPEIGHFSLILALFVACIQAIVPLVGARRNNAAWMDIAKTAACVQFLLITIAFGTLVECYIVSDFSVFNVVQNSHTDKPMLYKVAGVWGNHEGSMLLWIFILALYGQSVALFGKNLPPTLRARALAVQGMISAGFILFILFTSNPFLRVDPAPVNGQGLNPILQDPGLAFHPPFLYLGYVGFSMAFSFAIAALMEGKVDAAWARWVRPWTLAAWCFLTFGIAMGSWWAYYTLGWGGWWYWDPVENASFMPWLAGTALLHSSLVVERRDTLKSWTILLTIITFAFSLLGTFLVRSGTLTSVHSFASDPSRGVFILCLLIIAIGSSLLLYAIRAPRLAGGGMFSLVSRESALLFNNVLLSVAAATVLVGTLYPLFMDVLGMDKISVGPSFFNTVFLPLMVPLIMVMGMGPSLSWKRASLSNVLRKLKPAGMCACTVGIIVIVDDWRSPSMLWAAVALALAAWLFTGTMTALLGQLLPARMSTAEFFHRVRILPRSLYAMALAHAGLAIVIAGITCSTAWKTEKIQMMHIGDTVNVAGYDIQLTGIEQGVRGPNYTAMRATFKASKNGNFIAQLQPEKRLYAVPLRATTHAAIHTNFLGDIYAVIADPDNKGGYVTRLYYNPLVPWIFMGGAIMALGGLVSLTDRRYRIGAPLRKLSAGEP
jgi:cytochrome c-type biogenesis protein CcmF